MVRDGAWARAGRRTAGLVALGALLAGCQGSSGGGGAAPSSTAIPAVSATAGSGAASSATSSASAGAGASPGTPTPGRASSSTPAVLAQVPGPGTVSGALAHLRGLGFTCSSEEQPGIDSWVCTRYRDNPTMMAYVGGASGRRLGRLSLSVQDGDAKPSATALDLQRWVAQQVLPAGQAPGLVTRLAKGGDDTFATAEVGPVHARGSADGTIVAFVDGWVPNEVMPVTLLPGAPLGPALQRLGFTCSGTQQVSCQATRDGATTRLVHADQGMEVTHLEMLVDGPAPAREGARRVREVLGLFQGRDALLGWFARHQHDGAGATSHADGLLLDWYPGPPTGQGVASFSVREPCWLDTTENC